MISAARIGELGRFAVVGSIGFVVDATVLAFLFRVAGVDPLLARIPSFITAVIFTWVLHRRWTFRHILPSKALLRQFAEFFSTQLIGIGVNFVVFTAFLLLGPPFSTYPELALAIASIIAAVANYTMARAVVFSSRQKVEKRLVSESGLDRATFAIISVMVGVLGTWAILSQCAVQLGATFEPVGSLFVLSLIGGVVAGYISLGQAIWNFGGESAAVEVPLLRSCLELFLIATILTGSYVLAYTTGEALLFFACALAVALFGIRETYRLSDASPGTGMRNRGVIPTPVEPHQLWITIGFGILVTLIPLVLNRYNPDDANYLNLSVGMIRDPRPMLVFDTMIGDPQQKIHLPTYRVETIHVLNAVVAQMTGLSVIKWVHLGFASLASLFLFLIYLLFCRLTAGRAWLVALVVAMGVFLIFGDESRAFGNYSFLRLQQGKTFLYTGIIPLIYLFVLRFWRRQNLFDFSMLFLCQAAACSLTANGLYLAPLTVLVVASGLLIFEPGKISTYVVIGFSCFWPISMALTVLVTTGVYPSEFTEPVSILSDIASVYGGSPRALLMIAALGGWVLLSGTIRKLFLGAVTVFTILVLNPILSPHFADHITGNLNWRMLFVLPLPLLTGVAFATAINRLELSDRWSLPILGTALIAVAFSPISILSAENRVRIRPFGLDVPYEVYESAEKFVPYLTTGGMTLAPEEVAIWLATFEKSPAQVAVRTVYLQHYRHTRPLEDIQARKNAFDAITNPGQVSVQRDALAIALDRFSVTDLVLRKTHPNFEPLAETAVDAGFVVSIKDGDYVLLKR